MLRVVRMQLGSERKAGLCARVQLSGRTERDKEQSLLKYVFMCIGRSKHIFL